MALFLLIIGLANLFILRSVWVTFIRVRAGDAVRDEALDALLTSNGLPPSVTADCRTWLSGLADAVWVVHPGIAGAAVVPPGAAVVLPVVPGVPVAAVAPGAAGAPPYPRAGAVEVAIMLATSMMTPRAAPASSVMRGVLRFTSRSYAAQSRRVQSGRHYFRLSPCGAGHVQR